MLAPSSRPPLLVFADDWGRHPSSCQHLVGRLLGHYQVSWVNTIGMRTPRLDWATFRRGLGKLRQWLCSKRAEKAAVSANPRVLNPRMWPWFTRNVDRRLNRKLLLRQLLPALRQMPEPPVAITVLPIVADVMSELPVAHWVYYCVDDFSEWPGLDQAALARMEQQVVRKADVLIAASERLRDRLGAMGRDARVLTHGVDLDFWQRAQNNESLNHYLSALDRPLVTFWGVIDRRLDLGFLQELAERMTHGTIVLAGPENDPDPALEQIARVTRLGRLDFTELPHLARASDVLIMPYTDFPVTRAMQPLKFKEYLASGKPAVVRDLPATQPWSDAADLASEPQEFAALVMERLRTGLPYTQTEARHRLAAESWQAKTALFERWALLERPHGNGARCA